MAGLLSFTILAVKAFHGMEPSIEPFPVFRVEQALEGLLNLALEFQIAIVFFLLRHAIFKFLTATLSGKAVWGTAILRSKTVEKAQGSAPSLRAPRDKRGQLSKVELNGSPEEKLRAKRPIQFSNRFGGVRDDANEALETRASIGGCSPAAKPPTLDGSYAKHQDGRLACFMVLLDSKGPRMW